MKFPQKWIDALTKQAEEYDYGIVLTMTEALNVLRQLYKSGALKYPPKPREFYICISCKFIQETHPGIINTMAHPKKCKDGTLTIYVREVIDE